MMEGPGANSEEKHEPASYIDTALVDSLKALDPEGPIREADMPVNGSFAPKAALRRLVIQLALCFRTAGEPQKRKSPALLHINASAEQPCGLHTKKEEVLSISQNAATVPIT